MLAQEFPYIEANGNALVAIYNSKYRRLRAEKRAVSRPSGRCAANFQQKRELAIYYFNHARESDTIAPEIARNARSKARRNVSAEDV